MGFTHRVRCYIEDTDMGGIVYYVNYLKFFERGRTELLRFLGFEQRELQASGFLFVVHSLECRYAKPAQLDDELDIHVRITALSRTCLTFEQRAVRRADGVELCSAKVRVACVDCSHKRPCRIPSDVHSAFTNFINDSIGIADAACV